MGARLPFALAAATVSFGLATGTARAETFSSCWVEKEVDRYGIVSQVTRCRIAGGGIVDYASDNVVPSVLYPQPGTDLTGACWYYTSSATQYVILVQYPNGDADLGWDPDPSTHGGIVAIGFTYRRCTSEPREAVDPAVEVWEYVHQYIHPPPRPELNPPPGDGVTGLETYVGLPVPRDHFATLSSNGITLHVEIEVSAVIIDWGDQTRSTYPATEAAMAGYPDGIATHAYEVKNEEGASIQVAYDWTARWRVPGGPWNFISVPNTSTTVLYPVQEIVSVLTD